MQIKKQAKVYDVVVIGSGASGGMAAWNLTRLGVNVLMLDAGERFDPANFWMALLTYERRERRRRGEKPHQFFLSRREQPLITPPDLPFNFPSATEKNPTLTILAVSWRATDYLANEMRKGNL